MIWSQTFTSGGGSIGVSTQAVFWLDYYSNAGPPPGYFHPIFDQISFGTNDIGHTFTISSIADDPDFAFVANALTNGVDEQIVFSLSSSPGSGGPIYSESELFAGVGTGPDLIGYQIQSFGLHNDSLSFQTPGSNPGGDGNWTDWSGQATLGIYGIQVPEPSSAAVILLGGGILFYLRKHRRR